MKKIMILGAGILQLPAINTAKQMGLYTIAVDMNKNAVGFSYADKCLPISTINIPKVVEAAKEHKVNGVMTLASDMPVRTVAAVAKALDITGVSEETALVATNKAMMRRRFQALGLPIPMFFYVRNYDDYLLAVKQFNNSFVIKPEDNSGSRGVYFVRDAQNKENLDHAYCYSKAQSRGGGIVVEEYMRGSEVSVEALSADKEAHIIAVTEKKTTGAPEFVEIGHTQPARLSDETIAQIIETAKAAISAVGIEYGPSHVELIITDDGPKIVEIGARLGGDNIATHLVPLSTGVDMVRCSIEIAMGEKPSFDKKRCRGASIRYFEVPNGRIINIDGLREAENVPGVVQIRLDKKVGNTVGEILSSADRVGYVIAQGINADDAETACEKALRLVKFQMVR